MSLDKTASPLLRGMSRRRIASLIVLAGAALIAVGLAPRKTSSPPPEARTAAPAPPAAPASAPSASAPSSDPMTPVLTGAVAHIADDPRCVIEDRPPSSADLEASSPAPAAVDPRAQASRARLLARLGASPDPYANAVAVWLDIDGDGDDEQLAQRQRQLAAMAASTQDPRLYSLALRSCWRKTPACEPGLSARRWSEIEPTNALPWLMMFEEAAWNGDLSGMHEAMFHATQAQRLAERMHAPLQPIIDAAGSDPEAMVAARGLAIEAIGRSAAMVGTSAYQVCRLASPANANAWQECLAVADVMAQRSDSLLDRRMGQKLRQRLTGEPPAAAQAVANERVLRDEGTLFASASCDDLRGKLGVLRRMAVEGELAVSRAAR